MKCVYLLGKISAAIVLLALTANAASAQVVVDSKQISDDKEIQYIQFMYYMDQKTFKPVYLIDYGVIENATASPRLQKIVINNEEIIDTMSPVLVMNKLDKAGWEYMGDASYIQVPLMENLLTYTFRRKTRR